jgi:hypothetical protein
MPPVEWKLVQCSFFLFRLLTSRTVELGQGLRRASETTSDSDSDAGECRWSYISPPMPGKSDPPGTSIRHIILPHTCTGTLFEH